MRTLPTQITSCQDSTNQILNSIECSGPFPTFKFCGMQLKFFALVSHLGNILSSNFSDSEDITQKCRDMLVKADTLLSSFPHLNPSLLTGLFQTYCLSLHGATLLNTNWGCSEESILIYKNSRLVKVRDHCQVNFLRFKSISLVLLSP